MKNRSFTVIPDSKPVCVGTGLVTLDVFVDMTSSDVQKVWAGGSCGNVLTILAYLGWNSYPVARVGQDKMAKLLLDDLASWHVHTDYLFQKETDSTPVIIEKLYTRADGRSHHRFDLKCFNCGKWLPRYKPVLVKDVNQLIDSLPNGQVFYFDRVSRSSIDLAKEYKRRGALIFFEPSAIGDPIMLSECLALADIVKYSTERIPGLGDLTLKINIPLEIQTLGEEGLRYRHPSTGKWINLPSFSIEGNVVDTVGAGDWCSAGIINILGRHRGEKDILSLDNSEIVSAIEVGQALAAINCKYQGARGIMYNISKKQVQNELISILGRSLELPALETEITPVSLSFDKLCSGCAITRDSL